jgi:3-oxoacyl-[acyl-carrier protein] reductase
MTQQKILITGSSRGIGKALALEFARAGYKVLLHYHTQKGMARETADSIVKSGGSASVFSCDLADHAAVRSMMQKITADEGNIDALINNASVCRDRTLLKMTDEEWDAVLRTDLSGTFFMTQECAKLMVKQKEGAIINIASIVGVRGSFGNANYACSKAGVIALTKSAAQELGRFAIRVNAVLPGFHLTDMGKTAPAEYIENIHKESVLGCTTDIEELTRFVVLLARSKTISGQVFNWDSRII